MDVMTCIKTRIVVVVVVVVGSGGVGVIIAMTNVWGCCCFGAR